jgi:enoyl-[acyl-carrier-protein] reductase (NADH)
MSINIDCIDEKMKHTPFGPVQMSDIIRRFGKRKNEISKLAKDVIPNVKLSAEQMSNYYNRLDQDIRKVDLITHTRKFMKYAQLVELKNQFADKTYKSPRPDYADIKQNNAKVIKMLESIASSCLSDSDKKDIIAEFNRQASTAPTAGGKIFSKNRR